MASVEHDQIASHGQAQQLSTPKDAATKDAAVEVTEDGLPEEPKTYYSKLSIWLMILYSGLAIGSDGYNAAVIANANLFLTVIYPDSLTAAIRIRLSNAFLIGMIIGMLLFGGVVDQLGRKTGAIATTLLLVLGIAMSAGSSGSTETGMFWMLIVSRGIAGVGAGGEYPVSGAGAAEATDENSSYRKHRGFYFAMLADLSASLGYIWAALVPLLLLLCVGQQVSKYEIVWRTSLALGLVPPLSIFWFRMRMAISTAYRKSSMRKQRVPYKLAFKRYWRSVLGCSATWFTYNYVSVPFGIFAGTITSRVNPSDSLIKSFYIPGPFIGGYLSDKIGRRKTMALGFTLQALLGFIFGGANQQIQKIFPLYIVLYGLFLTLGEVGPGSTVVLTATESFPTSIRGQMMGFVSAWSKAGAAIGTQVFSAIMSSSSFTDPAKADQAAFLIGSSFALVGALIAWFVVPEMSNRLDDEDDAWKAYLAENGWEADWGDQVSRDPSGVKMDRIVS
ncbi:hypothetical protein Q7P36_008308 [Cladosporium allicinum]